MKNLLLFGNSGSGKSTLARALCARYNLAHLDLDNLAWNPVSPPVRRPVDESSEDIYRFVREHKGWVIEGCYTDLLEVAAPFANEAIYLNLSVALCIENARNRPWEPHKYESKEQQDANLNFLVRWISNYSERDDVFSKQAHQRFYERFEGRKSMLTSNERTVWLS